MKDNEIRAYCIDNIIHTIICINAENYDELYFAMGQLKAYAKIVDEIDSSVVETVRLEK